MPPLGPASGLGVGLTVRAAMPDDAAIRRRDGPRPGRVAPHFGVRPVIGRPKRHRRQDLCHTYY